MPDLNYANRWTEFHAFNKFPESNTALKVMLHEVVGAINSLHTMDEDYYAMTINALKLDYNTLRKEAERRNIPSLPIL